MLSWQSYGAFAAMVLWSLWMGRRHLRAVAGAVFAASQDRRTRARTGPVDSRGDFPRERRNIQKREPKRRNIERKPGRPRRKSNGQIVKEQRDAAYQTEWARQDAAAERARSK